MSTRIFGINQTAQFDPFSVFAGDFQKVAEEVTAGAEDLAFLSVVKMDANGTVSLVTALTDVIYGVIYDVQEFDETFHALPQGLNAGEKGIALTSGEFLGRRVVVGGTLTWEDLNNMQRRPNAALWFRANPSNEMAGRI